MHSTPRRIGSLFCVLLALIWAKPAHAWVEASVESQVVTVELDRQGKAQVTHELLVNVRGGPLESYTLNGVDSDAEPLPDAKVIDTRSGDATGIPLLATRLEDGSLRLSVTEGSGLPRGSYLFRFAYRTDLLGRGLLRPQLGHAELSWSGPRLSDGVDSAKAIFRFPRAEPAPSLPSQDLERAALGLDPQLAGVFMSNLVRGQRNDEIEVVRLHIAGREAPLYKLRTSLDSFNDFAPGPTAAAINPSKPTHSERLPLWLALTAGVASMLLVTLTYRRSTGRAAKLGVKLKPLLTLPLLARVLLTGLLLGASAWCALSLQFAWLPLFGTLLACALALHQVANPTLPLRGPGEWKPLTLSALQALCHDPHQRRFDWASLKYKVSYAALILGSCVGIGFLPLGLAERVLFALIWLCFGLTLGVALGRAPRSAERVKRVGAREIIRYAQSLSKQTGVEVRVLGRFPLGCVTPDEVRLRALPSRAKTGLTGVELGSILGAGEMPQPYLLVRVLDGSLAYRALPRHLIWVRGRTPEERVAVVSPRVPVRGLTCRLLLELLDLMREPAAQETKLAQKSAKSGGSGAIASNAPMRTSPAKAA